MDSATRHTWMLPCFSRRLSVRGKCGTVRFKAGERSRGRKEQLKQEAFEYDIVDVLQATLSAEVDFLMRCIESFIRLDAMDLIKRKNVRFSVIGNKSRLPVSLQSAISSAEEASHANKGLHFLMALNYGGRHEIAEACKKIASKAENGDLRAQEIDENLLDQQMMTNIADFPNPDLIIRTSGELRVSNFLLWQLAYAEFYFASKMFPDFDKADLIEALTSFQQRQRRYGKRNN